MSDSVTNYCPYCWQTVEGQEETCSACGKHLNGYHSLPYEEKLLLALRHPIRENRALAVHILGKLKSEKAFKEFEKQLIENDDIFDLYEIMMALTNYSCRAKVPWFMTMVSHPAPPVSRLARRLLNQAESRECRPSETARLVEAGREITCGEE